MWLETRRSAKQTNKTLTNQTVIWYEVGSEVHEHKSKEHRLKEHESNKHMVSTTSSKKLESLAKTFALRALLIHLNDYCFQLAFRGRTPLCARRRTLPRLGGSFCANLHSFSSARKSSQPLEHDLPKVLLRSTQTIVPIGGPGPVDPNKSHSTTIQAFGSEGLPETVILTSRPNKYIQWPPTTAIIHKKTPSLGLWLGLRLCDAHRLGFRLCDGCRLKLSGLCDGLSGLWDGLSRLCDGCHFWLSGLCNRRRLWLSGLCN